MEEEYIPGYSLRISVQSALKQMEALIAWLTVLHLVFYTPRYLDWPSDIDVFHPRKGLAEYSFRLEGFCCDYAQFLTGQKASRWT